MYHSPLPGVGKPAMVVVRVQGPLHVPLHVLAYLSRPHVDLTSRSLTRSRDLFNNMIT